MKGRRIAFLGGVHGVGKSTLAQHCQVQGVEHLRASDLIKAAANEARFDEKKRVQDIGGNQSLLISALRDRTARGGDFLLDGHFTLLDLHGNVERIPVTTFQAIRPSALAIVVDSADAIIKRLEARDKTGHDLKTLEKMQDEELAHARAVAQALSLPLATINALEETAFREWLKASFGDA